MTQYGENDVKSVGKNADNMGIAITITMIYFVSSAENCRQP